MTNESANCHKARRTRRETIGAPFIPLPIPEGLSSRHLPSHLVHGIGDYLPRAGKVKAGRNGVVVEIVVVEFQGPSTIHGIICAPQQFNDRRQETMNGAAQATAFLSCCREMMPGQS